MNHKPAARGDEPGHGFSLPTLYNLVYCSRATAGVNEASINNIIATARRYNPAQGITGLLVFGGGVFFQWLEGPRDNVTGLMAKIKTDPRHEAIVRLTESEEVRERLFPDWDMELVTASNIREVLVDARSTAQDVRNAAALESLLLQLDSGELGRLSSA